MAFEPALVDEQTVDDAGSEVLSTGFLSSPDDLWGYDARVRSGDEVFFKLTGDALDDEVAEAECYLGNFFG